MKKVKAHIAKTMPTATPMLVTQVVVACKGFIERVRMLPMDIRSEQMIVTCLKVLVAFTIFINIIMGKKAKKIEKQKALVQ